MHIAYDAPTRRRRRSTSHHYAYSKGNPLLTRNLQQSPNIIPSTFISFVLMSTNKRRSLAFVASSAQRLCGDLLSLVRASTRSSSTSEAKRGVEVELARSSNSDTNSLAT